MGIAKLNEARHALQLRDTPCRLACERLKLSDPMASDKIGSSLVAVIPDRHCFFSLRDMLRNG
jgi:hypothetical protein